MTGQERGRDLRIRDDDLFLGSVEVGAPEGSRQLDVRL